MKVNNLPTDYKSYNYLVVREFDEEIWYYGAWRNNFEAAQQQADEIENGHVVNSAVVERA